MTTNSSIKVNPALLEKFLLTRPDNNPLCRPEILLPGRPNLLAPHIMALPLIDNGLFDQRHNYT